MSKPSVYLLIRSSIDMNIMCVAYLMIHYVDGLVFQSSVLFWIFDDVPFLVFCLANTDSKGMSELSSLLYVYV